MNAKRFTRREALAVGLGAVVAGNVAAAPVPKTDANPSWVGKTVLPREYTTSASFITPPTTADANGDILLRIGVYLGEASYTVKGEKDSQLEVLISDGTAVRVERRAVVSLSDAVEFFTNALKENEKNTFALNSRGWAYYLLGKPEKAIADFDAVLKLTPPGSVAGPNIPARWETLVNRGLVYAEQGEFEKALKDLDEVIAGWPTVVLAYTNRGFAYELMGEYAKAILDYDRALQRFPEGTLVGNNKAWVLATCPDEKVRDGAEAVKLAKVICERSGNREGMFLDTLAAAYAEAGKFDDAVRAQEKALEDKSYVIRYGEDGQKRLRLYQAKKPFRTEPVKK